MASEMNQKTEEQYRAEWLEKRRSGIGGSDAAAILGLNPWKSALALWSEKCGLVEADSLADLEYVEWGNILEEPIAKKYMRITERSLVDHGRYAIKFSGLHPFMHCTIDREILPIDDRGQGDLSIKNVTAFKADDWKEEPPLFYQVQIQHELIVTGWHWGSFAVLIGGNKFAWCDVPRNERFCSHLIEKEEEFMDRVKSGNPPPADASDSTREVLGRLYPKDTGESVTLSYAAASWGEELEDIKAILKANEGRKQELENKLKAEIGNASIGLFETGGGYSWKHQERKGYVVEPTSFRVLRRIK